VLLYPGGVRERSGVVGLRLRLVSTSVLYSSDFTEIFAVS
jgi:hypothetical protein